MMWKAVYDSVAGASHGLLNIPCQDACRVVIEDRESGQLLIVACADGAGSAEHSHEGSAIACDEFIRHIRLHLDQHHDLHSFVQSDVLDCLHSIRMLIEKRAADIDTTPRQLATTLLGAAVGENDAIFLQVGDGAMIVSDGGEHRIVFWPQSGEYLNTTNFVTDDDFGEHIDFEVVDTRIDELIVFTDGLERLALRFDLHEIHPPFFHRMLSMLRTSNSPDQYFQPLRDFLNSERINDRTDDDKTLVLATRRSTDDTVLF